MRTLIITDTLFAAREWEMLSRLEIGLATEGVAVAHAMPMEAVSHVMSTGDNPVFSTLVPFAHSSVPFTLNLRAQRLMSALRRRLDIADDQPVIDLVHVFGGGTAALAMAAAAREEVPCVIEVWRSGMAPRLHPLVRNWGGDRHVFLSAPDAAIEREILAAGLPVHSRVVPWGVHTPDWVRAAPFAAHTLSAMVIGSGYDPAAMTAALAGLAKACPPGRELLVFVDADAGRRARLWKQANKLGIAGAVSFVDNLEARRDLLVAGDVLLVPEARGEHRTALLEAFACEMLVIAATDPKVACLIDGRTARLVDAGQPHAWEGAIRALMNQPAAARALTTSAKHFIEERHLASMQLRSLIQLYEWATGDRTLAFTPGGPAPAEP